MAVLVCSFGVSLFAWADPPAVDESADRAVAPAAIDEAADGKTNETQGKTDRGWIGLRVTAVPDALAAHLGLGIEGEGGTAAHGVLVVNVVRSGPAEAAGLQQHDVIIQVNDAPIEDGTTGLAHTLSRFTPGSTVKLVIVRGGLRHTTPVTLDKPRASADVTFVYPDPRPPTEPTDAETPAAEPAAARVRIVGGAWQRQPDGSWARVAVDTEEALARMPASLRARLPEDVQVLSVQGSTTTQPTDDTHKDAAADKPAHAATEADAATAITYHFLVDPDGQCTVTVRRGGAELTLAFKDEATFRQQASKLYERYEQLRQDAVAPAR